MRIKKYTAENMTEVITQIKNDFGQEAIILQSKNIMKGGFLGFFSKQLVEITAGIDIDIPENSLEKLETLKVEPILKKVNQKFPVTKKLNSIIEKNQIEITKTNIEKQLKELNQKMIHLESAINNFKIKETSGNFEYTNTSSVINQYLQVLMTAGFSQSTANYLLDQLIWEFSGKELRNEVKIKEFLERFISERIRVNGILNSSQQPQIIFLMGPTGVGKTTTIAKLAAQQKIFEKKRVGLVTIDTYRIAAIEQLKTYADILKIDLEVIYSLSEFKEVCKYFNNYDVVLIDTAGCSPFQDSYINELQTFYHSAKDILNPYLVLSLSSKWEDILKTISAFDVIPFKNIILTKIDETISSTMVLDLMLNTDKNLSYLSNGQDVPDDLELINPTKLTKTILSNLKI